MASLVRTFNDLGILRLAAVSPEHRVADIGFNLEKMLETIQALSEQDCRFLVFPELGLTAYTCADLFYQSVLLKECENALFQLADESARSDVTLIVGAP